MAKRCARFGQDQDVLGKSVQFKYKRGPRYGTILGGYCSLSVRIFIWLLSAVEFYNCFKEPIFTEFFREY